MRMLDARPTVLVVDADPIARRVLRTGFEIDGVRVLEATTLAEARSLVAREIQGAVVARDLPDGDGAQLLVDLTGEHPEVRLVLVDEEGTDLPPDVPPAAMVWTDKGDVSEVVDALALVGARAPRPLVAVEVLRTEIDDVVASWRELCRWDPLLPPGSQPPIATAMVAALAEAMAHPQPLGWGPDPEIEKVAEVYATVVHDVDAAIEQIVCLREAVLSQLDGRVPAAEQVETERRLHMLLDRAIGVAVHRLTERLQEEAFVDPLTGLPNRRALDRDLARELARAARYRRHLAVVVLDLDGLKEVNDTQGHAAGDSVLRAMAGALLDALRRGDGAYRMGGDEFAMLLPEIDAERAAAVVERVARSGAPRCSWGAASFPDDASDTELLLEVADRRLYRARGRRPDGDDGPGATSHDVPAVDDGARG